MTDTRLAGADFVRALACLMVVAHHVAQRVAPEALPPEGMWAAMGVTMGAFGVAAFFVLSGYLLSRPFWLALDNNDRMPSLRTYAIRRAARILPGFWLALTVTFLLSFTVLRVPFDGILVLRYLSGLFLVSGFHWLTWFPVEFNGPLWSLGAEIISYAALPICLALLFKLPFRGWWSRIVWLAVIVAIVGLQFLALRFLQAIGVVLELSLDAPELGLMLLDFAGNHLNAIAQSMALRVGPAESREERYWILHAASFPQNERPRGENAPGSSSCAQNWWAEEDSNLRPPACDADALPN